MLIYSIPGKIEGKWNNDVKAMIDIVSDYSLTLEEFRDCIFIKGLAQARANGCRAWIVDSSTAKGSFKQEIQQFIGKDVFPAFADCRIKYFITITSKISAITKMTVSSYAAKVGPFGIRLLEFGSLHEAIEWLKNND